MEQCRRAGRRQSGVGRTGCGLTPRPDAKPILLGRSIYYGLFAYLGVLAGSLWWVVVLQALFVGTALVGFARHVVDPADRTRFTWFCLSLTGLLALTPLTYFVSVIMPDALTGITIMAGAVLIVGWWAWAAAGTYGALAHSSHVLILLVMGGGALAISPCVRSLDRQGALLVVAVACLGIAGEIAFALSVRAATGLAPIRPPFVTARLVEDGPGTEYLKTHCNPPDFFLCRYRARLPLASDDFLWRSGVHGVFKAGPATEQRALADEQGRFVQAVVADRPLEVARTMLEAIGEQAWRWRLSEFRQDPVEARIVASKLPAAERAQLTGSAAYRGTMATEPAAWLVVPTMLAGLIALGMAILSCRFAGVRAYLSLLAAGWLADIMVCGALSTPHDRYQARVVWLFAVAVAACVAWTRGRETRARQPFTP